MTTVPPECPQGCFKAREEVESSLWKAKVDMKYLTLLIAAITAICGWFAHDMSVVKDVNAAQDIKIATMSETLKNIEKSSEATARSVEEINRNLFRGR